MADAIDFERVRTVVELGAGTGAVTRAIVDRLPTNARLFAVDNNLSFVEHLRTTFPDARVQSIHGQAGELAATLEGLGVGPVDAIVSSLGLTSMTPEVRNGILGHLVSCLQPGGVLIQYQYLTSRWSWLNAGGKSHWPFEAEGLLGAYFGIVATRDVMWNIPPARVFICREPFGRSAH